MLVVVVSMMALGRTCLIAIKLTSIFVRPQVSLDLAREITVLHENPSNWKRTKVNGKSDKWKRDHGSGILVLPKPRRETKSDNEIPALLHSVHLLFYVNVVGRELRPEDDVKPTLRRKRKAGTERREDDVIHFPFTLLFYRNTGY
ncbi:hypothetical protein V1478_012850 [Vespula squamosa]|uniref:Secreted protein n=1 Tax=Vespula squamosa TaxID=30214 RepID=A0ABD2A9B3_VESSQ